MMRRLDSSVREALGMTNVSPVLEALTDNPKVRADILKALKANSNITIITINDYNQ